MNTIFHLQELHPKADGNPAITNVHFHSDYIEPGGLFIPLTTGKTDGHLFLSKAIDNGAVASLWESGKPIPPVPEDFLIISVSNTLKAFQTLATAYRKLVQPKVVGITGSNGKTTTKDILYSLLAPSAPSHKTEGNYNNHIGLPLTLLNMPRDTKYCILEMGMNQLGEIQQLSQIAQPDYAVITNIGDAHLEHLKNRGNIAIAKGEITSGLQQDGLLYFDGDEPLLHNRKGHPLSFRPGFIDQVTTDENGTYFSLHNRPFFLPLHGAHQAKNASYAIEIAKHAGVSYKDIQQRLQEVSTSYLRMEKHTGKNKALIFADCYNASPVSMIASIRTITMFQKPRRFVFILGDMMELGNEEKMQHEGIAHCFPSDADIYLITVGEKAAWIADAAEEKALPNITIFKNDIGDPLPDFPLDDQTIVLLKGSRTVQLENYLPSLTKKE